ncbi:BBP7 family outer membrane beta-barrel protein [Candidatus Laterigemmans baculatus]|uniref:BBP7 family outer membrane beta-barrel protein n=1 Tax=Candidatus Laterigemmans baculatus TaxID=2770505 RepID=UPI0013DD0356|nr:BBP7 family outer membrane beta-barrel protein [Candidatus Laterigemmans baculatus]
MLRTKLSLSRILPNVAACCAMMVSTAVVAAPPSNSGAGEPDYEASGFIVPAGYAGLNPAAAGQPIPPGAPYGATPMYEAGPAYPNPSYSGPAPVAPAGYAASVPCDGSCGGGCGGGGCPLGLGRGGLLGRLGSCLDCGGCGMTVMGPCHGCAGGRLSGLRHLCLFCQGSGCGVCQSFGRGHLLGALAALAPYTEAGLGAQRWYDISAEVLLLSLDTDRGSRPVTSLGPAGPIVLSTGDVLNDDLEAGMRLSAAFICGAGGNVEVTYMGLNEFGDTASVSDPGGNLFSYISEFGTEPVGGFDDTDRSLFQGLGLESRFHSGEVNYRRRWVGPYSRFQGSWLAGIRYVDFDEDLLYRTEGLNNDTVEADDLRFFQGNFKTRNAMTGFQLGGDLWWNVYPGINVGMGLKGAALGNRSTLETNLESNSIGPGGVAFPLGYTSRDADSGTAWLTEFNATAIYRFAYSWSFRTSYYVVNVDNVALGTTALDSPELILAVGNNPMTTPESIPVNNNDEFTVQGVSFGVEYLW